MKYIHIVLLTLSIITVSSCVTTNSKSTVWGPEYLPDQPWRVSGSFVELDAMPVYFDSNNDGNLDEGKMELYINP